MNFSTELDNLRADLSQHQDELVCTDMRLGECHDAFIDAKFYHVLEDGFAEQVPAAGVELPVAECACTAFAE